MNKFVTSAKLNTTLGLISLHSNNSGRDSHIKVTEMIIRRSEQFLRQFFTLYFRFNTLNGTTIPLTEVTLDFCTLRDTKPEIFNLYRTITPITFIWEPPPPPPHRELFPLHFFPFFLLILTLSRIRKQTEKPQKSHGDACYGE